MQTPFFLVCISITVTLFKNGEVYDTVTLNAENGWTHTWTDLNDASRWSVDEVSVPEGYTKNVTSEGYDFTITNTREYTDIDITVNNIWYGTGVKHPTSVGITLYRDGEVYDTVTLSAANNWTHTWEGLTDEFRWTVDEPSVPSGYVKTVRQDGWSFTVVNTHIDIPKTGDTADLLGMAPMTTVGILGFIFCLLALFRPRRKDRRF